MRWLVNSCRSEQCTTKIAKLCSVPMSSVAKGLPIMHVSQKGNLILKIIEGETGNEGKDPHTLPTERDAVACQFLPFRTVHNKDCETLFGAHEFGSQGASNYARFLKGEA
ncbi:hypothetical protein CEXT_46421 [Caerostris extrusa]|uniref:Uncharacterized protein n=1 Tax=Caerostris extrusa TaxID=172846 RepID=A0AAV4VMA9_CAEEX|nr:hypothetical protein CEXT_46421 [Caerostris extrusa]